MLVKKNLETKRRQGIVPVSFWLLLAAFGFPVSVQKPRYLRFSSMKSSWLRFLMTCFQKSCSLRDEDDVKSSFCAEFIAERSTEQVLHNVLNGCCGRRSSEKMTFCTEFFLMVLMKGATSLAKGVRNQQHNNSFHSDIAISFKTCQNSGYSFLIRMKPPSFPRKQCSEEASHTMLPAAFVIV